MESIQSQFQSASLQETRDWRKLPDNVIHSIGSSFNSLVDFFSFRNSCPSWRSVVIPSSQTLASQSPILLLPIETYEDDTQIEAFIDLSSRNVYKVPPFLSWSGHHLLNFSHGYLAMGDDDGLIRLRHIFTRDEIHLPETATDLTTSNIIFSEKPSSPQCIFIVFQPCYPSAKFCMIGSPSWNQFKLRDFIIMDMAFFQGQLYALLTKRGSFGMQRLAIIDIFPNPTICFLSDPHVFGDQSFLVSSDNELRLYSRNAYYYWESEAKRWVATNSLSGRSVFISASQYTAWLDPNNVYGVEADFAYMYDDDDVLSGSSIVDMNSNWDHEVDFYDLIGESASCSGRRPVWIFPSLCF